MTEPSTQPRLALVAWRALPAVLPAMGRHVGGLETGAWELARGLSRDARQQVTFVTEHWRCIKSNRIHGVDIHVSVNRWRAMREDFSRSVDLDAGLRLKRFSWRLLYQVPLLFLSRPWRPADPPPLTPDPRLLDVQCDVWAAFGVNQDSARVVATARRQQRPSILFLESNADLSPADGVPGDKANEYGVTTAERLYCLEHASAIVCQSQWQMDRLQAVHGRPGRLIRNPICLDRWAGGGNKARAEYVLWIGRYDDFHKRPLLALEVARLCPELPFRMIINASSPSIEQQVRAAQPQNVSIVDYVPYDRMPEIFHGARVFLSTSAASHEGFPNVVLQAAASGTPIVSLEDFDDFIESSGAGRCSAGNLADAARHVRSMWAAGKPPDPTRVPESLRAFEQPVVARQVADLASELLRDG